MAEKKAVTPRKPKALPKVPFERIMELRFTKEDEKDVLFKLVPFKRGGVYILQRVPK